MKTKGFILYAAIVLYMSLNFQPVYSQYDDIGTFLKGGISDAENLFEAYLTPYANSLGADLSGGWYNTAKVHKKLGFDITLTFNTAFVPKADKEFEFIESDYNKLSLVDPSQNMVPTAASKEGGVELLWQEDVPGIGTQEIARFKSLDGTKVAVVPMPMVQGSVGLVYGTDLSVRFIPKLNIKDVDLSLWGVGLKHSLKQWIPVIKSVPILHLSVQAGYTRLKTGADISFEPSDFLPGAELLDGALSDFTNQRIEYTLSSMTGNLLVSANLPVICFYGGVGFVSASSSLKMLGNFPVGLNPEGLENGENLIVTEKDPIDMSFGSKGTDGAVPRLNAGIRFKFGPVTLHGDYTRSYYSMVSAGLGVTFR